jgi:4'-phosphopantetheinyl transferase
MLERGMMVTNSGPGRAETPLELVTGTDVEVVRWTNPAGDGECTVVWLPTDRLDTQVAAAEVTAGERQRAAGYTRHSDRLLSLGSAWLTRRLVAALLEVPPLVAPISRDCPECAKPHGRPVVGATTKDGAAVHVSATHSRGLVGVAISRSGAVGVDVEDLAARGPDVWPTVWRVLGRPTAAEAPESESEAAHTAATAWVRTEAVLKATGYGLAAGRRSVDITTGPRPRVTRWPWGDPEGRASIFDLRPGNRYVAALAVIHQCPDMTPAVEPATPETRQRMDLPTRRGAAYLPELGRSSRSLDRNVIQSLPAVVTAVAK